MRKYFSFILITTALFMGHGCIKDELAVGEIDEGTITDLPTSDKVVTSRHICVRREIYLDIDSLLGTGSIPFLDFNLCKCDTIDLWVGKLPENVESMGFVKAGSRVQEPSKKRLGIITKWQGQLILTQNGVGIFQVPINIDLVDCN